MAQKGDKPKTVRTRFINRPEKTNALTEQAALAIDEFLSPGTATVGTGETLRVTVSDATYTVIPNVFGLQAVFYFKLGGGV